MTSSQTMTDVENLTDGEERQLPYRPPSLSDYPSARDLFDDARRCATDADRIRTAIMRMESREGARAQSYGSHGRSGHRADAMRETDRRIDYESRMRLRQQRDYDVIDLACDVLYGADQLSGGLSSLLSPAHADCVCLRYCNAEIWDEVAAGCGMSVRWCEQSVPRAMELMDAYGLDRVRDGLGLAAD